MRRNKKILLSIVLGAATALLCGCPIIAGLDHDYTSNGTGVPDAFGPDGTSPGDGGTDGRITGDTGDTGHPTDGHPGDSRRDSKADAGDSGHNLPDAGDAIVPPTDSGVDACPSACNVAETMGWTLVAYDTTGMSTCPAGFTAMTVDTPTSPGSCACSGCGVMTDPDCESGQVTTTANGATCTSPGPSYPANEGVCMAGGIENNGTSTFTAPPPGGGGACLATATPTNAGFDKGIVCVSATSCATAVCEAEFKGTGSSFQTCLYQAGDQTCPPVLTTKHAVGASVTTACDTCSCTVTAMGCSGLFKIYAGMGGCAGSPVFTASTGGSCESLTGVNAGDSYLYTAAATGVSCTNGTSNATDTVNSPGTICCP